MKQLKSQSPPTIRCAIYTRKSTEEGLDQQFNSLDAQREASEAFITSQRHEGWVILPQRYDDGGFSGGSMERPGLKRLMDDISAGMIDCVVVYKVDRLSRSLLDFARVMGTFDNHGVSFVSVTQQFNTTHSMGRLTLNILLSFAQFEREIIGERIRDKLTAHSKRGQWTGGFPVLGYDVDRGERTPKLVINGDEATKVRCIFALYLELKSLGSVCIELSKLGWRNKSWRTKKGIIRGGREFDKTSLYSLLANPLYAGKIKHKDNLYAGQHEAIIDQRTFDRVQAQLRSDNNNAGNRLPGKYGGILKGLLRCPNCNVAMVHTTARRGTRSYRYYKCLRAASAATTQAQSRSPRKTRAADRAGRQTDHTRRRPPGRKVAPTLPPSIGASSRYPSRPVNRWGGARGRNGRHDDRSLRWPAATPRACHSSRDRRGGIGADLATCRFASCDGLCRAAQTATTSKTDAPPWKR